MKHQIYLKKETSELIERAAKQDGKTANRFIKDFLEALFNESLFYKIDTISQSIRKGGESNGNGQH